MRYSTLTSGRGFTLIEMLVYMAVLVVVVGALVTTFLSFNTVFFRNTAERALTEEARIALEYILGSIRQADMVNVAESVLESSPGTLVLSTNGIETTFEVSSSTLTVSEDGNEVGPLTSDAVGVDALTFIRYEDTATELVRIALTLSVDTPVYTTTKTFYASAVVRGTYE